MEKERVIGLCARRENAVAEQTVFYFPLIRVESRSTFFVNVFAFLVRDTFSGPRMRQRRHAWEEHSICKSGDDLYIAATTTTRRGGNVRQARC